MNFQPKLAIPFLLLAPAMALAQTRTPGIIPTNSLVLYGKIDESIDITHFSSTGKAADKTGTTLDADSNFFGFRGTEDLGGGVATIFKIEGGFNANNGAMFKSGYIFNRQTYVGLTSPTSGTLMFGLQYSAPFWISVATDPFVRVTNGSIVSLMQQIPGHNTRGFLSSVSNAVQYVSPQFHGISGRLFYAFGDGTSATNLGKAQAASLKYQSGPLYVQAAYENQRIVNPAPKSAIATVANTTYVVGATYDFQRVKIHGYYMRNQQTGLATVNGYMLGLTIPVGLNTIAVSALRRSDGKPDDGAKMFAIGFFYPLSKQTVLYTTFARLVNGSNGRFGLWPAVLTYATQNLPTPGQNETSVQFGIRHYF